METTVIDRARAERLAINVMPSVSRPYGDPIPFAHEDIIAVCIGCGQGLTAQDDTIECRCWSGLVSATVPCLMCRSCWNDAHEEVA